MYSYPFINLYIRNRYEVIFEVLLLRLFKLQLYFITPVHCKKSKEVLRMLIICLKQRAFRLIFKLAIERQNKKKNKQNLSSSK